jgi:hypothetical protein
MTGWTPEQLAAIAEADELSMQPRRADGVLREPVPVWVVRDGDNLYVRSFRGDRGAWYRDAAAQRAGHIRAGGVTADVTFAPEDEAEINDRIDAAYQAKYRSHGARYVAAMLAAGARATTLSVSLDLRDDG